MTKPIENKFRKKLIAILENCKILEEPMLEEFLYVEKITNQIIDLILSDVIGKDSPPPLISEKEYRTGSLGTKLNVRKEKDGTYTVSFKNPFYIEGENNLRSQQRKVLGI